jgi:hypothetical protein
MKTNNQKDSKKQNGRNFIEEISKTSFSISKLSFDNTETTVTETIVKSNRGMFLSSTISQQIKEKEIKESKNKRGRQRPIGKQGTKITFSDKNDTKKTSK